MTDLNRKDFLKAAGSGSAALAIGSLPLVKDVVDRSGQLTFRATAGLPQRPLPSYATQVVDGQVDLARGTGLVTSRVLAGHPDDTGLVGLPGLTRVIRITSAENESDGLRLSGLVDDRSQLRKGERAQVEILIDRKRGIVTAPFIGRPIEHNLASA